MDEGPDVDDASFWGDANGPATVQQYRTLVNLVDDGIYQLDAEGRFIAVNDIIVEMSGYDREELLGEPASLLLGEDDYQRIQREISRRLETGEQQRRTFELVASAADGRRIPCELRVSLLVDDGEFRGSVGIARDISTEERGRELLRKERQYDAIFNDPNILVGLLEPDGTVLDVNDTAMEYTDVAREDVTGERFWETPWWGEGDSGEPSETSRSSEDEQRESSGVKSEAREWIERAAAGEYVDFEGDLTDPAGEQYTISGSFRPVTDDDGEVVSIIVSGRDITERRRREHELTEVERHYQTLVDNFPAGAVALVDEDLRYVTFGGTPVGDTDLARTDLEGEHPSDVLSAELAEVVVPYYEAALDGETIDVVEPIGDRTSQLHFVPVRDERGDVTSAMGMSQDITEQKERERDLRDAKAQLEAAVEAGAVGTWEWHVPEDRFVAGTSFAKTFGVDPEAAREGVSIDQFVTAIHEDDRDRVERQIDEVLADCGEYEAEYRVRNADGEFRWVVARGRVECDEDDNPVRFPGALADITNRKRAEMELQRNKNQLEALIDVLPVGVVVADADGAIVMANDTAHDIWGGDVFDVDSVDEYERYPVQWADSGEPVPPEQMTLARVVGGEEVLEPDIFEIEASDGERRIVRTEGMPVRDERGEVVRGVVTITDITERREAQRKLEESNERLEQFAYAASHDLQEPLRMVTSYLQLVERRYADELDDDGREFIDYAVDGANRMREMIEGLLEYSRVETQGDPFERVDLDDVLADVREDLQVRIEETDAEITSDDLPPVEGDPSQLRQVFQNLLDNAIEYRGDEPPRIDVTADQRGDEWVISVRDEGIGIDPADADRVFEVFQRLHSQDEHAGTGIGLALCKRIVERHGGDIWVESEPGEGATFSFELPAADA